MGPPEDSEFTINNPKGTLTILSGQVLATRLSVLGQIHLSGCRLFPVQIQVPNRGRDWTQWLISSCHTNLIGDGECLISRCSSQRCSGLCSRSRLLSPGRIADVEKGVIVARRRKGNIRVDTGNKCKNNTFFIKEAKDYKFASHSQIP